MKRGLVGGLTAIVAVSACSQRPSSIAGAPSVGPDEQFEIGGTQAARFLVWTCLEGKRVVMIQSCAPHSCGDWRVYKAVCGAEVVEERAQVDALRKRAETYLGDAATEELQHHSIPEGSGWR